MPVMSISKSEFFRLLGRSLSQEELESLLEYTKVNLEAHSDEELEFEVTSDRMDLVTMEGLVRTLKGLMEMELGLPRYPMKRKTFEVRVSESVKKVRPYVVAALVKGVDLTTEDSLIALIEAQEKIHDTLGRKRKRVSIGLHDFSKVVPPIIYDARPADKISFVPLGEYAEMTAEEILEQTEKGREYAHLIENPDKLVPLILDSRDEVLSLPPIINSELTRLTPGVRDLFIDVTGTDLRAISYTLEIIASALAERGGEIHTLEVKYPDMTIETPQPKSSEMVVSENFIRKMVGIPLTSEEIVHQLRRARLDAESLEGRIKVLIPGFRADFLHPVDVAEEVATTYGLNNLGYELPQNVMTVGKRHPREKASALLRTLMVGLGYQEVLNYIMTSRQFLFSSVGREERPVVEVANPVSESYSVLRDSLIPGLLHFLAANTHSRYPQKVFEIGDVVVVDESFETRARDERRLAAAYADYSVGFEDIYSHLRALADNAAMELSLEPHYEPPFLEGRCASILIDGIPVGVIGEINPDILLKLGITVPVAIFELRIPERPDSPKGKTG
ncbi:MAG TPA: phenylalanine--tRNA ligase subunit beta [Candidatus Korarchaeota archaeon]|nr:phenylalanine--tRNA ligase subunit beta [Candidatus Korarchaeota archaeon]